MKSLHLKRTLLVLMLLVMTLSAVTGGTIAWFTDSVSSTSNVIQSGNLDIELDYSHTLNGSDWATVQDKSDLFNANALWEPGYTEYVYLNLTNKGNLAVKYDLGITFKDTRGKTKDNTDIKLSEHLRFGLVDVAAPFGSRAEARAAVTESKKLVDESFFGSMTAQNQSKTMALVIYMPEEVGNEANHNGTDIPKVTLGIKLQATQLAFEDDSFNNQYDANATPPSINMTGKAEGQALTLRSGLVEVTIPADAPAGGYALNYNEQASYPYGETHLEVTIDLLRDGKPAPDISYDVLVNPGPFLYSDGFSMGTRSSENGPITFAAAGETTFTLKYYVEELQMENGKVTGGIFTDYNPADYDSSLRGEDSEYIAVNYERDSTTYFVVGKRASTVVIAAGESNHVSKNGNYSVMTNQSGKLWNIISGLQSHADSNVFILPGTYNEGTTIYIYSSMTIMGLGDTDDVKIIKTSSSSSNRHLFNANGTRADYIEVTIRNLTLDATAKTTNSKDNAAVQSIRKSKVKCYDLNIIKGTGWDAVAFYVNGNNAVDGVKYPAYLYAENCTLDTTRTFGIVSTAGTYKFYHTGLTYNNGASSYTNNSSSIKNIAMDRNDWIWD